jgi:hypothetical protein
LGKPRYCERDFLSSEKPGGPFLSLGLRGSFNRGGEDAQEPKHEQYDNSQADSTAEACTAVPIVAIVATSAAEKLSL